MPQSALRIASEDQARRLPKHVALTIPAIQAFKPPAVGRARVYDTKTPGLTVEVTATGAKTFYVYRRIAGRPTNHRLGAFPGLKLDQARRLAAAFVGEVAAGRNPHREQIEARGGATFGEVFKRYMEEHSKLKKRTWREDEQKYDLYLKPWANRKATDISFDEVSALHARVGKTSPGAANRLISLISSVYNKRRIMPNPAAGVAKFKETKRERFLLPNEMPAFFAALDKQEEVWRDFFRLALFTGARCGNVKAMEWTEINFAAGLWVIEGRKFKTGDRMTVPLIPQATDILKARLAAAPKDDKGTPASAYVFPGPGRTGHVQEPKKPWAAIRGDSGLTDLRIHDLRRSLGSWQAAGGTNLSTIAKTLGHRQTSTTAIYARLDTTPVREAMAKAVNAIEAAAQAQPKGND